MTDLQYKMAMDAIGMAAHILTPQADQLAGLVEAERSMHSYLHVTDPTMYRKAIQSKSLQQQVDLAKAALLFIATVQRIKAELAEPAST